MQEVFMSTLTRWQSNRNTWPQLREKSFWASPFADMFDRMLTTDETLAGFPVDLAEEDDRYVLKAELPGVKNEDLSLNVENDVLTISAEKKDEYESRDKGLYRRERSYGKFSRSFQLNGLVNADKVDAEYKDGVLSVTLPKREETRGRQIQVKTK